MHKSCDIIENLIKPFKEVSYAQRCRVCSYVIGEDPTLDLLIVQDKLRKGNFSKLAHPLVSARCAKVSSTFEKSNDYNDK